MEPTARTSAINFEPTVLTENTSRLSTTKELTSKICEKPGDKSSVEAGAVDDFSKISNSRELASVQHKTRRYRAQRRLTAFLRSKNIQVRLTAASPRSSAPRTSRYAQCHLTGLIHSKNIQVRPVIARVLLPTLPER